MESGRVVGVVATNGETFQFSTEFDYEDSGIIELLKRTEQAVHTTVRSCILDGLSSRDYTDIPKWMLRFPTQALAVSESIHFGNLVLDTFRRDPALKPDFDSLTNETIDFVKAASSYLEDYPMRCHQISFLIAMKLRHRDIVDELKTGQCNSIDTWAWKRHLTHSVRVEKANEQVMVNIGGYCFAYGYEMLADVEIGFFSNEEEAAALALAGSLTQSEFVMCKLMNSNRDLVKPFADFCGIPCFTVARSCLNNAFAGAVAVRSALRLPEIKELPVLFPNFFGLVESKIKVLKLESHFRDVNHQQWNCLIHIDETHVPTWLMQRLRPIHLLPDPPEVFVKKIAELRPKVSIDPTFNLHFVARAIRERNANELLSVPTTESIKWIRGNYFFDVPELFITHRLMLVDTPLPFDLPETFHAKISELAALLEDYDGMSPHAASPEIPIRPFASHVTIYSKNLSVALIWIFAAFGESLRFSKYQLYAISETVTQIQIGGYRPVIFEISSILTPATLSCFVAPVLSAETIGAIMTQTEHLFGFDLTAHIAKLVAETNSDRILNDLARNLNLLRHCHESNSMLDVIEMADGIFAGNLTVVPPIEIFATPLRTHTPVIITGPVSSGKRKYAKALIAEHFHDKDVILHSSAANEALPMAIFDHLKFLSRGLYQPPE
jgi:hypothetical protein